MQDVERRVSATAENILALEAGPIKKVFWSQHLASITLSLIMFLVGLGNGWSSPYLAQLSLKENVGGIPKVTEEELSWVASLMNVGRIFGCGLGAIAQDTVGRKMSLCFAGIPMLSSWICIAVANSVQWLFAARVVCGVATGMVWTTLSLHLAEIADPEIRGSLVLWNITTQAIGLFIGNLMGPIMSMKTFAYVAIFFNILFLGLFPLVPDSPYRLIMIGDLDKAEAALKWFRRKNDVKQELQELQDYVSTASTSLIERLKELGQSKYRKGFFMLFLINIFNYFGASNVTNSYMEIIVTISQANVTPSIVVTTVGAFSIISGLTATFLVDRFGRRLLLITSNLGMAISMACLGLHFQLLDLGFNPITLTWLPCSCLLVYTVSYNAGAGSIPSTLVGEIFSPKLKTIASLTFSGTSAVFSSMSTGTFVPIQHIIGINFLFWFYATGTFVSVLYYYFFIPETMGKSLQTIQIEELEKHSRKNSKA